MPDPLDENPKQLTIVKPASLATFAEKLRRDLREPWVETYWQEHPVGTGVGPIDYALRPETQKQSAALSRV